MLGTGRAARGRGRGVAAWPCRRLLGRRGWVRTTPGWTRSSLGVVMPALGAGRAVDCGTSEVTTRLAQLTADNDDQSAAPRQTKIHADIPWVETSRYMSAARGGAVGAELCCLSWRA